MSKALIFMNRITQVRTGVRFCRILFFIAFLSFGSETSAQRFDLDLSRIDGMDITPENVFQYQLLSTHQGRREAIIRGVIRFRGSDMRISYTMFVGIESGLNQVESLQRQVQWEYSSSALKELFQNYKLLPQGTYEYCVTVTDKQFADNADYSSEQQCILRQSRDLFMINLIEPEDDAKLYEYYPMLSWVATYPIGGALSYRLRVAEVKNGQSNYNAITRNNPVYQERDLINPGLVYPVYAKSLKPYQPYAWTVDAYYKGILLGGAEPWKFTIVEDSVMVASIGDP
ncbi:MAG: hypothetical protein EOP51_27720 [Sphingobacteriales bacterium]|nr:MAG: hypothetical protein EOP51_27720 [Sphingobacteriales bacterium]